MIRVAQFGEGNFLRTFADVYFDNLNKNSNRQYEVHIIQPIPFGNLENFHKQNNRYHVVLRGTVNTKDVEDVYSLSVTLKGKEPFIIKIERIYYLKEQ